MGVRGETGWKTRIKHEFFFEAFGDIHTGN